MSACVNFTKFTTLVQLETKLGRLLAGMPVLQ